MAYADVEKLLCSWLATTLSVRCVTDLPADLVGALPLIQVTRFGGADTQITVDRAHVDIDCYAADRSSAAALAEQVRTALRFTLARGAVVNGAVIGRVETISGPSWRPYDDTALRRFGAAYRVTVHSH